MNDRPNFLLITTDQQHFAALGMLNPSLKTPNLDALAAQGRLFNRTYCPNPNCSPSRSSVITGRYPSQHGCWSVGAKLPEDEPTLGESLQEAGYRTALVGKAHFQPLATTEEYPSLEAYPVLHDFDFWRRFNGPYYGFEHVELLRNHTDEPHVGQHYALWLEEQGFSGWRDCFQRPTGKADPQYGEWNLPEEYHYNTWIAERTGALMRQYRDAGDPFFLWASFPDPHPPYLVPAPWHQYYDPDALTLPELTPGEHDANPPHFGLTQLEDPDFSAWQETEAHNHGLHSHLRDREKMANDLALYFAMITLTDKYIGQIIRRLDKLGLRDNTVVVFTTDHGHLYGQHGLTAKGPFHYEDLIRVPFIVRAPRMVHAGEPSGALQSLVDVAPTFMSLAGLEVPGRMSGVDQSPVWHGEAEGVRDHVVVENRHQPTALHLKTYIDGRYKLTVYYQRDYGELFDLQRDPDEVRNLWYEPDAQALKAQLIRDLLYAEMGKEPLWMPRISGA